MLSPLWLWLDTYKCAIYRELGPPTLKQRHYLVLIPNLHCPMLTGCHYLHTGGPHGARYLLDSLTWPPFQGYYRPLPNPTYSQELLKQASPTCRHYNHYFWNSRFTIRTDHQPLTSVFKQRTKSPRMCRWILEMRDYHYKVEFKSGKKNI